MNRTEQRLWIRLKDLFPGVVTRVENVAMPGFPDVHGVYNRDYWVELKVLDTKNSNDKDPLILLRDTQIVWATKRLPFGVKIFILIGYKKEIRIFKLIQFAGKLGSILTFYWHGPMTDIGRKQFSQSIMEGLI
jgi:hypothetical protein